MPSRLSTADEDPLSRAIAPPPNESPAAKEERLAREKQAKLVSDAIDEEIHKQRVADKKAGKAVKLLLLGQSESGKSTTLKNFQLIHSPNAFNKERISWRAIIQLNVVRSIRIILDAISEFQQGTSPGSRPTTPIPDGLVLTPEHLKLRLRLIPLLQVEETLVRKLLPAGTDPVRSASQLSSVTNLPAHERKRTSGELSINSSTPWKGAFEKIMGGLRSSSDSPEPDWDDPQDPGVVMNACLEDMQKLWTDPIIQSLLQHQKIKLEELAGFFLDSLDRVAAPKYIPTDDDILRARLKTLGVSEHRFKFKSSNTTSRDWRVFDVGGQRSLRAAWVPFFDDMDAILFLAPISCFDQVLEEDPNVNRLEDSILLWKAIVSHPLLKNTSIILFLNKCDILRTKLESGTRVSDYVISYGDRPNDFDSVSSYMKKKFGAVLKEYSVKPRQFFCHLTSVTDTKSTSKILRDVQEIAVRSNLEAISLI